MDYRDFWVAVAAAAPVIGLTHVVVWERFLRRAMLGKESLQEARKSARWRRRKWWARGLLRAIGRMAVSGPYWMGSLGFGCSFAALVIALHALSEDHAVRPGSLSVNLLAVAMLTTVAQAALATATETIVEDLEDIATAPESD